MNLTKDLRPMRFIDDIALEFPQVDYQSNLLRKCSPSTHSHCLGAFQTAFYVGFAFDLPVDGLKVLSIASLLHDLGKANLSGKILEGPNELSESEWSEMKSHPLDGYNLILGQSYNGNIERLKLPPSVKSLPYQIAKQVADAVLGHHEHNAKPEKRYPADPYAEGFEAKESRHTNVQAFLFSQIICACDILDALLTYRHYKDSEKPRSQCNDFTEAMVLLGQEFMGDRKILEVLHRSEEVRFLYCNLLPPTNL